MLHIMLLSMRHHVLITVAAAGPGDGQGSLQESHVATHAAMCPTYLHVVEIQVSRPV
jgi:hypothetical protein